MTSLQSAAPRHRRPVPPLRIAMLGVPADADGNGAPSAVEQIGTRLVRHGHEVTVYGGATGPTTPGAHRLRRVTAPVLPFRSLEAPSRTAASAAHLLAGRRPDVAFLFRDADPAFVPVIRARGTAVAVHLDGLSWQRRSSGVRSRASELLVAKQADALIVDSPTVRDHYLDTFGVPAELIGYGAPIVRNAPTDLLEELGLVPGGFHLLVLGAAPLEHLDAVVEGFHRSDAHLALVVAASSAAAAAAGAAAASVERLRSLTTRDPRIRVLDGVAEQRLLDQLYAHAASSLHAATIGAADPSLLRAMGAGAAVVAWDAVPNREIAGTAGSYCSSPADAARRIEEVERYPFRFRDIGELMQERARTRFDWDVVAEQFQTLAAKLSRGYSTRGMAVRRGPATARPEPASDREARHG